MDLSYLDRQSRSALFTEVELPEFGKLRMCNTHFGLLTDERIFQARELGRSGLMGVEKFVLAGDFNDWNFGVHRLLRRDFQLSSLGHGRLGLAPSFPSFFPILSLDRVYHTSDLEVRPLRATLAKAWKYSDHRPLAFTISYPGPAPKSKDGEGC